MPPAQDVISDTIAAITTRLAARHDGLDILRAVTEACSSLLSADATGVLIADPRGGMEVVAASDERTWFVELLQGHAGEGPCVDCIAQNTVVASVKVDADSDRWPRLAPKVTEAGFVSVYAFPLRLMQRAVASDAARALLSAHSAGTGRPCATWLAPSRTATSHLATCTTQRRELRTRLDRSPELTGIARILATRHTELDLSDSPAPPTATGP